MSAFQVFSFCPRSFSFCLGNFCFLLSQFLLFDWPPAGRRDALPYCGTHFCPLTSDFSMSVFQRFSISAFQLLLVECNALTREMVSFEQALDRRQSKMLKGEK